MPTAPPRDPCKCGCGRIPSLSPRNFGRGTLEGQPQQYCKGHHTRAGRPQLTPPPPPPTAKPTPAPAAPEPVRATGPLWEACMAGREPAESLDTRSREDLHVILFDAGWTLDEVAAHTRQTAYTTARIARQAFGYVPGAS